MLAVLAERDSCTQFSVLARTILGLGLFWTSEGRFWGWGYFGPARDDFGAGAILDQRGTILGLGLFWTSEGRFWGWG